MPTRIGKLVDFVQYLSGRRGAPSRSLVTLASSHRVEIATSRAIQGPDDRAERSKSATIRAIRQIRDPLCSLAAARASLKSKTKREADFADFTDLRGSLLGCGRLPAPEHEDLGNILVQLRAPEISRGCSQKPLLGLCRVVVRHTEQIRQIRKIRQIRDHALLLAAALGNRKNTPGKGFTDLSDFRVHGSDFSISTGG